MMAVDWIKLGSLIVSAMIVIWTVFQFIATKKIEAKKPYLEYQLDLYQRTISLAAKIGVIEDSIEREKLIIDFTALYYGELGLVESLIVESHLVDFYNDLRANDEYLRLKALELASVLRKDLAIAWGTPMWMPIRPTLPATHLNKHTPRSNI